MKRNFHINLGVIALALLLSFAGAAQAQEWYTANQHQFAWDAVEGATSYKVYLKARSGGTPILIGDIQGTQTSVTMPGVGRYFPCVQSVADVDLASEIVCSDVAENCLNSFTFGLKLNPGNPHNLR